eukprot:6991025-Pyramimonas_sp.AAC.2
MSDTHIAHKVNTRFRSKITVDHETQDPTNRRKCRAHDTEALTLSPPCYDSIVTKKTETPDDTRSATHLILFDPFCRPRSRSLGDANPR